MKRHLTVLFVMIVVMFLSCAIAIGQEKRVLVGVSGVVVSEDDFETVQLCALYPGLGGSSGTVVLFIHCKPPTVFLCPIHLHMKEKVIISGRYKNYEVELTEIVLQYGRPSAAFRITPRNY